MKILASTILVSALVPAMFSAARHGADLTGQQPDLIRLTLLAGPQLTSSHPGLLQTGPIPSITSANPPAFLYNYRETVFETVTTDNNKQRLILRVRPPEALQEFAAPPAPASPATLRFNQRFSAQP